jgi:hypothetical protein
MDGGFVLAFIRESVEHVKACVTKFSFSTRTGLYPFFSSNQLFIFGQQHNDLFK